MMQISSMHLEVDWCILETLVFIDAEFDFGD